MRHDEYTQLREALDGARALMRVAKQLEDEAAELMGEFDDTIDLVTEYTTNKPEMTWDEFCKESGVRNDG